MRNENTPKGYHSIAQGWRSATLGKRRSEIRNPEGVPQKRAEFVEPLQGSLFLAWSGWITRLITGERELECEREFTRARI